MLARALILCAAGSSICGAALARDLDSAEPEPLEPRGIAFSPPGGHFSVRLAAEPAVSVSSRRTLLGAIRETRYAVETGDAAVAIELYDLPRIAAFLLPEGTILDRAREGLVEAVGGRVVGAREAPHRGHPAREVIYEIHEQPARIERALLVLVGHRLYIALASWPGAAAVPASAEHLFESFEVWRP